MASWSGGDRRPWLICQAIVAGHARWGIGRTPHLLRTAPGDRKAGVGPLLDGGRSGSNWPGAACRRAAGPLGRGGRRPALAADLALGTDPASLKLSPEPASPARAEEAFDRWGPTEIHWLRG